MFRLIKGCLVLPLSCLALLIVTQGGQAAFTLELRQGATSTVFVDNGAGDTDPTVGNINLLNEAIGNYTVSLVGVSSNQPGTPTDATLTLSVNKVSRASGNGSSSPLQMISQDTDFTLPGSSGQVARLLNSVSSSDPLFPAGGSVSNQSFAGTGFGTGSEVVLGTTAVATITNFGADLTESSFTRGETFDLRQEVTISLGAGQTLHALTANTVVLAPVPEPASMILMLSGMGACGLVGLVRRARKQD